MICYDTGETVLVGDKVDCDGYPAIIEMVLEAGTQDAKDYACPDGGILVREEKPSRSFGLMSIPVSNCGWDNLVFLARAPTQ